jgi:hypothetical protein
VFCLLAYACVTSKRTYLTGFEADYDDMASPHRSESFFQDDSFSPSVLLVPTGDGDSFEVVMGPVLTLVKSEEVSFEQEGLLVVEPVGDELVLIEGDSSHISTPLDEQSLMIIVLVYNNLEVNNMINWLYKALFMN